MENVRGALKTRELSGKLGSEKRGTTQDTGPVCQSLGERIGVGRAVCSVMCRGGFRRSVCVRFPSRFSGRRRRRLLVSLRAGSDEKMQQDRSERIVHGRDVDVATIVHCLLSVQSFPASDIFDSKMQFLLVVSHSMGAHTEAFRQRDEDSSSSSSSSSSEEDAETEAPTAMTESTRLTRECLCVHSGATFSTPAFSAPAFLTVQ